ncbi:uncharacterized protein LOC8086421 [Sorghum bicolor]|uniref:DUF7912 domain-containing protein n=1 Tax=Sorghum bicolor TaxID=4558 RepID=C5X9M3_SORBI|nr:uncharacterized protein LOC8086421 [Sorghum bicolor]EER97999.1 hypothetical protein SORBI_3002G037900 [Sorghum bicolor]|eukprot:XP_002461478.1 uncharacterized protein LOC8086421 [Sorghum bicolor]
MAGARARALRALLARCSTKCHRRASPPCPSSSTAAASFSSLSRAVTFTSTPASRSQRLLPAQRAAATAAHVRAQTRFLASEAARRGVGGRGETADEEEEKAQEWAVEWEDSEDDGYEPEIGDGGDGGGVALRGVEWGQRALVAAEEVLADHFGDDVALFAFKVSPKGYVYMRLDKLTNVYGCPDIEEIENFNRLYKQKLDEIIERGEISLDLALEVSSPGAERLLKVPEDLDRFKDMAMRVQYLAEGDNDLMSKQNLLKDGIFLLQSVDIQSEHCVWKLADVKENRAEAGKGRPLNRKQRDWRLQTSFTAVKKVTLYLDSN